MRIVKVEERNERLIENLLEVWESSVKATHLFLSHDEICCDRSRGFRIVHGRNVAEERA